MAKRCIERTKAGRRCQAFTIEDSEYCWAHDPTLAKKRARARSHGGRQRAYPRGDGPERVETMEDVLEGVNAALRSAWELDNTAERGRLLASLYDLAAKIIRPSEVEERLEALERSLGLSERTAA